MRDDPQIMNRFDVSRFDCAQGILRDNEPVASFVVEHDSPLTAWGQVRRDLRRRVDEMEFACGDRIPSEAELVEHYGVSRVTIRRTIAAMVSDGYLVSRRGSGTYVTGREITGRYDLDLYRPWREQLIALGHEAYSRHEPVADVDLPVELEQLFGAAATHGHLEFAREVHLVNDVPIGVTESWTSTDFTERTDVTARPETSPIDPSSDVVAECFAEIGFATTIQAELLHSYLDIPLIVVHARSRTAHTRTLVELSRTSWLASRVRLAYVRELDLTGIDRLQSVDHARAAGPSTQ